MKVINANQFKTRAGAKQTTPLISCRANGVTFNKPFFEGLKLQGFANLNLEFAEDNGQLHVRFTPDATEDSAHFKQNSQKNEFICHNKGLSDHLKATYAKDCDKKSVPFKVQIDVPNEDGWMPVITSYWKTLR